MTSLRASNDTWLSACLLLPCFNIVKQGQEELDTIIAKNDAVFITSKVPADAIQMHTKLETLGFCRINSQLTFRWRPGQKNPTESSDQIRFTTYPAQEIASSLASFAPLFEADRFNSDPRLPRDWSLLVKNQWIAAPDKGKLTLVARFGADLAGFVMLQHRNGRMVIDLIAVAPRYQGQKVGLQLLSYLQDHICKQQDIMVGTQHDNLAARKLYSSAGFECVETKKVYHFYSKGRS